MSNKAAASQEYVKSAVMTASPEQLQLMLLDGALRFSKRALAALEAGEIEGCYNALDRAQRIVLELWNGMRRDINPELVDQMASLYSFIHRRLVDANIERERVPIQEAIRILEHQRETWILLMEKIASEREPHIPDSASDAAASDRPDSVLSIEG